MYSYGSGLAASLWSVVGRRVEGKFALSNISSQVCRALRYCIEQQRASGHMLYHSAEGAGEG